MFAVYAVERADIIPDQYILLDMDLELTFRNFSHNITTKTHTNIYSVVKKYYENILWKHKEYIEENRMNIIKIIHEYYYDKKNEYNKDNTLIVL